jgi:hypothetical protein
VRDSFLTETVQVSNVPREGFDSQVTKLISSQAPHSLSTCEPASEKTLRVSFLPAVRIPPTVICKIITHCSHSALLFSNAESEGFEPSVPFTGHLVSSEALSTTQPTLHMYSLFIAREQYLHLIVISVSVVESSFRST